ncbi:MAG: tetratricopeptide repeat protein, partial [Candidatus Sulfotelmatobacter sp.]
MLIVIDRQVPCAFFLVVLSVFAAPLSSAQFACAQEVAQTQNPHRNHAESPKTQSQEELSAQQRAELLKQRNSFANEAQALRDEGKLPEAIVAVEKMLAIEQKVFGNESVDGAGSLTYLATLHADEEDFTEALKCQQEALTVLTKLKGDA